VTEVRDPSSSSTSTRALQIAHVLFMDIVAYSQLPMDEQTRLIEKLQQIVRNTTEFSRLNCTYIRTPCPCRWHPPEQRGR
jgi:hypothetical protein